MLKAGRSISPALSICFLDAASILRMPHASDLGNLLLLAGAAPTPPPLLPSVIAMHFAKLPYFEPDMQASALSIRSLEAGSLISRNYQVVI
jgi:hypothetical protein